MRKSIIYLCSILILITGLAVYCFNLNDRTSQLISRDKLKLQSIFLPDISNVEYILYDIVSSIDPNGYTDSYPYYYVQINRISEEETNGEKTDIYKIDIQWANSGICRNDTAIGYISQDSFIDNYRYFILTKTNLDVMIDYDPTLTMYLTHISLPEDSIVIEGPEFDIDSEEEYDPVIKLVPRNYIYDKDTSIIITSTLEQKTVQDKEEIFYMLGNNRKIKFETEKYWKAEYFDSVNGVFVRYN